MSDTIVIEASLDDTWTCDHWQAYGIWTTKAHALDPIWTPPRNRRCCATVNPIWWPYCQRCGFPQPAPQPTPAMYVAGLLADGAA